jgi:hypothetical protein
MVYSGVGGKLTHGNNFKPKSSCQAPFKTGEGLTIFPLSFYSTPLPSIKNFFLKNNE